MAVFTQGDATSDSWVSRFVLQFSLDGVRWSTTSMCELDGNIDASEVSAKIIPASPTARFVRVLPTSWHNHPALRLELFVDEPMGEFSIEPLLKAKLAECVRHVGQLREALETDERKLVEIMTALSKADGQVNRSIASIPAESQSILTELGLNSRISIVKSREQLTEILSVLPKGSVGVILPEHTVALVEKRARRVVSDLSSGLESAAQQASIAHTPLLGVAESIATGRSQLEAYSVDCTSGFLPETMVHDTVRDLLAPLCELLQDCDDQNASSATKAGIDELRSAIGAALDKRTRAVEVTQVKFAQFDDAMRELNSVLARVQDVCSIMLFASSDNFRTVPPR
jgi:hypothetical protein